MGLCHRQRTTQHVVIHVLEALGLQLQHCRLHVIALVMHVARKTKDFCILVRRAKERHQTQHLKGCGGCRSCSSRGCCLRLRNGCGDRRPGCCHSYCGVKRGRFCSAPLACVVIMIRVPLFLHVNQTEANPILLPIGLGHLFPLVDDALLSFVVVGVTFANLRLTVDLINVVVQLFQSSILLLFPDIQHVARNLAILLVGDFSLVPSIVIALSLPHVLCVSGHSQEHASSVARRGGGQDDLLRRGFR
mmetsp:Transcript_12259/g.30880  ORF Transcript_12259/g.30880 Transcript_12259/m.30880 type:complete len:247 (+) Transcript_12259:684-1424(+)